jgi:hypothetical protein
MFWYCATACSVKATVCGLKIGSVEATLPPSLARASNWSSQLPRAEDFRISPMTSCALAPRRPSRLRARRLRKGKNGGWFSWTFQTFL